MSGQYKLNSDWSVEEIEDTLEWGKYMGESDDRQLAVTVWPEGQWLSTVFLGLDHSFGGYVPILFETMAFGFDPEESEWSDNYCERYATAEEAVANHKELEKRITAILGEPKRATQKSPTT
jgi:hypothetical protein